VAPHQGCIGTGFRGQTTKSKFLPSLSSISSNPQTFGHPSAPIWKNEQIIAKNNEDVVVVVVEHLLDPILVRTPRPIPLERKPAAGPPHSFAPSEVHGFIM
jgi:hypothetical protein